MRTYVIKKEKERDVEEGIFPFSFSFSFFMALLASSFFKAKIAAASYNNF